MADTTEFTGTQQTQQGTGLIPQAGQFLSNVQQIANQPSVQRSLPAIIAVVVLALGLFVYSLLQQPERTTLYASLPDSEKSKVQDALKNLGVDVTLDPTTGEILVPVEDYHRSRISLAAQGLPSSAPDGYSTLTDLPMGSSRSVELMRLKQTQEIELAKSIREIEGVISARVHLALPEKSVFVRNQLPPTASVFVQLPNGRSMASGQVNAIIHLVSSSIPNMTKEDVTVIDQNGQLLSKSLDDPDSMLNDAQLEHRVKLENIYRSRITTLVTPIVGPGNVSTQVNIDIDFTRSEITEEIVDPDGTALRSEQSSLDESANPEARGIPGALSNAPPLAPDLKTQVPDGKEAAGTLKQRSQTSVKNYEVSRKVETTKAQYGEIKKIKAAVIIREKKITNLDGVVSFEKFSDEKLLEIKSLVQEALGFDEARGDSVTVTSSPFVDILEKDISPWYENESVQELAQQLATVLILAIVIFGALHPLLKRVLVPVGYTSGPGVMASDVEDEVDDKIEVQEGESLEDIKAKLKPKKAAISAEMLDTANTYDDKVAVIRMIVGDEAGRVSSVFKNMMEKE